MYHETNTGHAGNQTDAKALIESILQESRFLQYENKPLEALEKYRYVLRIRREWVNADPDNTELLENLSWSLRSAALLSIWCNEDEQAMQLCEECICTCQHLATLDDKYASRYCYAYIPVFRNNEAKSLFEECKKNIQRLCDLKEATEQQRKLLREDPCNLHLQHQFGRTFVGMLYAYETFNEYYSEPFLRSLLPYRHLAASDFEFLFACAAAMSAEDPSHDIEEEYEQVLFSFLRTEKDLKTFLILLHYVLSTYSDEILTAWNAAATELLQITEADCTSHTTQSENPSPYGKCILILKYLHDNLSLFPALLPVRDMLEGLLRRTMKYALSTGCVSEPLLIICRKLVIADPENRDLQNDLNEALRSLCVDYSKKNLNDRALTLLEENLAMHRQFADKVPDNVYFRINLIFALLRTGDGRAENGRFAEALALYRESLQLRKTLTENDLQCNLSAIDWDDTQNYPLSTLQFLDKLTVSVPLSADLLTAYRYCISDNPLHDNCIQKLTQTLSAMADGLQQRNDLSLALALFRELISIYKGTVFPCAKQQKNSGLLATVLCKAAAILQKQGKTKNALQLYEEALQIRRRRIKGQPMSSVSYFELSFMLDTMATFLQSLHRQDEAMTLYEEALQIDRMLVESCPDDLKQQRSLSISLERMALLMLHTPSKADESHDLLVQSITIREQLLAMCPDNEQYIQDLTVAYYNYGKHFHTFAFKVKAFNLASKHPQLPLCKKILEMLNKE